MFSIENTQKCFASVGNQKIDIFNKTSFNDIKFVNNKLFIDYTLTIILSLEFIIEIGCIILFFYSLFQTKFCLLCFIIIYLTSLESFTYSAWNSAQVAKIELHRFIIIVLIFLQYKAKKKICLFEYYDSELNELYII